MTDIVADLQTWTDGKEPSEKERNARIEIVRLRGELAQCATELEEAANIIAGCKMPGAASLFRIAANKARADAQAASVRSDE